MQLETAQMYSRLANETNLNTTLRNIETAANTGEFHTVINTDRWRSDPYNFVVDMLRGRKFNVITSPTKHRIVVSWYDTKRSLLQKIITHAYLFTKFA